MTEMVIEQYRQGTASAAADGSSLLSVNGLHKRYDVVHAVDNLSFELFPGESVALCGENGAGKSSVFKMLAGEISPSAGTMTLAGKPYQPLSASAAVAAGVSMVHQEFNILPGATVTENVFLGRLDQFTRLGFIQWTAAHAAAAVLLKRLHLDVDPRELMGTLSPSTQKMVELARALSTEPRVLLLDEITASLDHGDCQTLHEVIVDLKARKAAIVYVSHRLQEIFQDCDRVVVMKDGAYVTTRPTSELTEKELSMLMVGRDLKAADRSADAGGAKARMLKLDKVSGKGFDDVTIDVKEGQIVTIAGLAGSGADEILEAIFGVHPIRSGRMEVAGKSFAPRDIPDAMAAGVAMVPKERAVEGLIENHDIASNIGIVGLRKNQVAGFLDPRTEYRMAEEAIKNFHIKCRGPETPLRALSGGNKQKVLLAKWFMSDPKLILLNNPTRGVDVGVKFEIYELIDKLRRSRPMAILMASEDMAEVIRISDVVVTMRHGRVSGVFEGSDQITESNLIQAML